MEGLIDGLWNTNDQRLRKTFSLALALHVILIAGLSFTLPAGTQPSHSLDVTLTQYQTDKAPLDADFVAQENQYGSGNQAQILPPANPRQALLDESIQEQQPAIEQHRLAADSRQILAHRDESDDAVNKTSDEPVQQQPLTQKSIGAIHAELDRLQQAYSNLPRVLRMTSVSAKSADEAAYMRYFEQRVEQIGNLHYPHEARSSGLFGQVRLVVVLLANGSVKRIEVAKGAGSRVLDQAAVRSVQLAAPFKPFPKELRSRDEIHIIRTWQYQRNNILTTN
jgi:protein TonB